MTTTGHTGEWDFFGIYPARPAKGNARLAFCIFKDILILLWFRCAAAAFSIGTKVYDNSGQEIPMSPEN